MSLLGLIKVWKLAVKFKTQALFLLLSALAIGLGITANHYNEKYLAEVKTHAEYVKAQEVLTNEASLLWQAKINRVTEDYVDRVKNLTIERNNLLANVRVLQGDLTTAKRKWVSTPDTAKLEYASTLADVFGECVTEYTALAVKADGHLLDAERLRASWPTLDDIKEPPN